MGWIALSDRNRQVFNLNGIGADAGKAATAGEELTPDSLLIRGSIVVETNLPEDGRPQQLIRYNRDHPWVSRLSLQAIPGGAVVLVITQGKEVFHTALEHDAAGQADRLRITYSWDAPARWGRLSVERIGTDKLFLSEVRDPKPLLLSDLRIMALDPAQRQMDREVDYFAVSTRIEPVGPMPSLTARVPVLTSWGYRAAHQITRGDLLRGPDGGTTPVLATVRRTVPARGAFRPVRLRAPYFGLQQDIVVAPGQLLRLDGSDVDYLFGQQAVLVPAGHLVNGVSAMYCDGGDTVTYSQFVLPGNEPVVAAGAPLETLFLGRMRRKPAHVAASLLAGYDRSRLPEHPCSAYPVLKPFEAITLAELRAA
ncbi:Hint domain-containing protein [Thalassovita taeanensis]|uniref:Hint domain-containing protein n=1 Tax=Thalassovita taeanensis TaxID=657014 RepID=A0A1H9DWH6_9RHOB|nr:Hint domain-containing protein [Thalassovita taeanensis]SEQ17098.1 Hint domain-containing protein [Thalassovita taeanensis]